MTITKNVQGSDLTIALDGRLDTLTSPQLEEALTSLDGITNLCFDFSNVEYISSAGLRVLLSVQKRMNKQGSMCIEKANPTVLEVFDVTGFSSILTLRT